MALSICCHCITGPGAFQPRYFYGAQAFQFLLRLSFACDLHKWLIVYLQQGAKKIMMDFGHASALAP
jgi:hypothetical protein